MAKIGQGLIEAVGLERERNPQAKAAVIARILDRSREAIRLALLELGLPTRVDIIVKHCACGKKLALRNKTGYCQKCLVASITHCRHGHPYDEQNTYVRRDGRRECRVCVREQGRRWQRDYRKRIKNAGRVE